MNYILKGKCAVEEPDCIKWAKWFQDADRSVKKTTLNDDVLVSTVFLGLDHQFGDGPPLLFETEIFGGDRDGDMWRYATWDEAENGHDAILKLLQEMPDADED